MQTNLCRWAAVEQSKSLDGPRVHGISPVEKEKDHPDPWHHWFIHYEKNYETHRESITRAISMLHSMEIVARLTSNMSQKTLAVKFIIHKIVTFYNLWNTSSICSWFSAEVRCLSKRSFKLFGRCKATQLLSAATWRSDQHFTSAIFLLKLRIYPSNIANLYKHLYQFWSIYHNI